MWRVVVIVVVIVVVAVVVGVVVVVEKERQSMKSWDLPEQASAFCIAPEEA